MDAEGERTLSASRVMPVGIPKVWQACTTKEAVERWWSPEDLRTSVRRWEVRSGGRISLHIRYLPAMLTPQAADSFRAAGVPIAFDLRGTLREVSFERLLDFDLKLELGRAGAGIPMATRFELARVAESTEVRVVATGADTPHWASLGQRNLESQLERLERVGRSFDL